MESSETQDPPGKHKSETQDLPGKQKSWVEVAKEQKELEKFDLQILTSEGKQSVTVPAEIVEEATPLWKDFLIARFLDTAPHVAKVHMILNKIWRFGGKVQKIDVYEMDSTSMRIRIPSEAIRGKVIRRGVWNIAGVPMVVSEWNPNPVEDEAKRKLTPLWVHLSNVPMSMYSWQGLSFISSAVGVPDKLHPETLACINFEVAKVCVKADLSKQLPRKINFTIDGKDTLVEFTYPGLPSKCNKCGKWGHSEIICREQEKEEGEIRGEETLQKKQDIGEVQVVDTESVVVDEVAEAVDTVDNVAVIVDNVDVAVEDLVIEKRNVGFQKEEVNDLGRNMEIDGNQVGKEVNEIGSSSGDNLEGKVSDEWKRVLMGSPRKTPQESGLGITPSRFAALSNLEGNIEEEGIDNEGKESIEELHGEKEKTEKNKVVEEVRQNLPRNSKTYHRVLSEASKKEIGVTTRGSRKHH